ncbi:hypothetical protein [uncultured phage MedDCM-OCT-S08-C495]|jgi:hypothetical protein|nr:hypothetical protein [uncultured phage MedDCM-OCT-S08-C495]BAR30953.1 hypothetical protein [uncultured Mediterranean phage uvMED]
MDYIVGILIGYCLKDLYNYLTNLSKNNIDQEWINFNNGWEYDDLP